VLAAGRAVVAGSHRSELCQNTSQRPNARRERVAISLDRFGQEIEKRECFFISEVKVRRHAR
jgi:hypothetical protein